LYARARVRVRVCMCVCARHFVYTGVRKGYNDLLNHLKTFQENQ